MKYYNRDRDPFTKKEIAGIVVDLILLLTFWWMLISWAVKVTAEIFSSGMVD